MDQSRIKVAAFGDITLEARPPAEEIAAVGDLLAPYDLTIGNLDVVPSLLGSPIPRWVNLHAPRELAHDLKAAGVDLVSLANNHIMDFGSEGMLDARRALDEAGVRHAGAGVDLTEAMAPVYLEVKNRRIAFFSVACTVPEWTGATGWSPGVAPLPVHQAAEINVALSHSQPGSAARIKTSVDEVALARLTSAIAEARKEAEIVLVAVHQGVPRLWRAPIHPILQDYERPLCRALIDAGADAVLGGHAHELHPIEIYRERPIIYCLGNFWIGDFQNFAWMERETIILELDFPGSSSIPDVAIVTLALGETGLPRRDPAGHAAELLRNRGDGVAIDPAGDGRYVVTMN